MRSYSQLAPTFWTRGSGKKLRSHKEAQIVALYLMSSPATNMVGIFHLAMPTLCHETGLSEAEARLGLARCAEPDVAIAYWDEAEELVWVPALAKHQIGEEMPPGKNGKPDNRATGVRRALAPFRGHRFHSEFMSRYGSAYRLTLEAPSKGVHDVSVVPSEGVKDSGKPLARGHVPDPDPDLFSLSESESYDDLYSDVGIDSPSGQQSSSRIKTEPPPALPPANDAQPLQVAPGRTIGTPMRPLVDPEPKGDSRATGAPAPRRDPEAHLKGSAPAQRADVKRVHKAWKDRFGMAGHEFRGPYDFSAVALASAIDTHGEPNCLLVVKYAPDDGMVSGRDDKNKVKHESIKYIFENTDTFARVLRAAEKGERRNGVETLEERFARLKAAR